MKLLWKQLLQPHVDYCSQLYFQGQSADLETLEDLQRKYTKKIKGLHNLNYWERLHSLHLYSQERRIERYRILYVWKTIEGRVPNCGIKTKSTDRHGSLCEVPKLKNNAKTRIKTLQEKRFTINGPMLFNILPKEVRNLTGCSVEDFKAKLDSFLSCIPDQPKTPGLIPEASNQFSALASNSLVDQARKFRINGGG